jgi:hypothetical protein
MRLKRFLAGFFFIGFLGSAGAQSNECEQALSQAAEEFNAGHFYGIPSLMKSCIERNEFTNEQRVRAYLLLCQAYLIINDPIAAEDSYLKLLKADPEYVATYEKDPVDIVYLSKKFTSTPVFTPHIRIGGNTSFYRTIQDINPQTKLDKVNHILKPGFQFGAGVDWNINDNLSLCTNIIVSFKGFKNIRSLIAEDDILTVTERQFWLDVPVFLKYSLNEGRIRPFGYVGGAMNLLLSSKASMVYLNSSPSTGSQTVSQGADVDLSYLRRTLNRSLVIGGGVRYKIGKDFVFADLQYMAGLSNLVNGNIYSRDPKTIAPSKGQSAAIPAPLTNDALSAVRDLDGFFRLDNLSLSIGYIKPLYDPRKIKIARGAKSVSRKIRKQGKHEDR